MGLLPLMKCRFYQRKDRPNRWVVTLYWKGKRYYRTQYDHLETLSSERLALRIAEQINGDLETCLKEKRPFDPCKWFAPNQSEMAFKNYAETWLGKQKHYSPSYLRDVNRHIQAAIDYFKLVDIREIRAGGIEDFIENLPDYLSAKSRKNYLITLHKFFNDAFRREDIPHVPPFPVISVPEPETKWLIAEDQDKVFEYIPKTDLPIFTFLRTYACRPGEARALQWDCVDFEKEAITLKRTFSGSTLREHTKTRTIRFLPIVEPIASLLKEIRGLGGFVFRNSLGHAYGPHINRIWTKACKEAGVDHICLYNATRHSWASQRASEGMSLKLIGKILGHTNEQMTARYAKISMEGLKTALLPNRFQGTDNGLK